MPQPVSGSPLKAPDRISLNTGIKKTKAKQKVPTSELRRALLTSEFLGGIFIFKSLGINLPQKQFTQY